MKTQKNCQAKRLQSNIKTFHATPSQAFSRRYFLQVSSYFSSSLISISVRGKLARQNDKELIVITTPEQIYILRFCEIGKLDISQSLQSKTMQRKRNPSLRYNAEFAYQYSSESEVKVSFLECRQRNELCIVKNSLNQNQKVAYSFHTYFNMGNQIISKELVIATLNYSGILLSPFEFYSEQMKNEQKEVSDNFLKILKDQDPNFDPKTFKWDLGKIDKKFQKSRYSPIYKASAGIHKNELINQQKFKELWMKEFKFYSSKFQFSYTQEEMNNTMMFDLTCYKAIILTVYKKKQLKNMDSLNVQEYRKYMEKFFSKVFLDEKKKLSKVFQALEKRRVDVAFFQQISQEFMQCIPHKYYFIGEEKDQCGILLLKTSFKKVHNEKGILQKYHPEFIERLTWNGHRCISFADNFIFINAHLTSKVEKNHEQQIQLLKAVQELKIMHPTLKIVMGMDANSFLTLSNPLKADNFHCYPDHYDIPTTKKTRTWMQPQTSKANEPVIACRDHILSSVPLIKPRVVSIEDNPSENVQYLPTSEHPHDHFVVTASIRVRSIKERMQQ